GKIGRVRHRDADAGFLGEGLAEGVLDGLAIIAAPADQKDVIGGPFLPPRVKERARNAGTDGRGSPASPKPPPCDAGTPAPVLSASRRHGALSPFETSLSCLVSFRLNPR